MVGKTITGAEKLDRMVSDFLRLGKTTMADAWSIEDKLEEVPIALRIEAKTVKHKNRSSTSFTVKDESVSPNICINLEVFWRNKERYPQSRDWTWIKRLEFKDENNKIVAISENDANKILDDSKILPFILSFARNGLINYSNYIGRYFKGALDDFKLREFFREIMSCEE